MTPAISTPPPTPPVLPNPVFEGSEKRVEIDFNFGAGTPTAGLRALSRAQLDELMGLAACTIVSMRRNEHLDAYVLSESSLFIYPGKWVLKTCGTTKLLNAVPRLLQMAAELGMESRRCKFSRASFLFPEQQPFPHTSFDHEAFFLRKHFSHLGNGGSAYVLGDMFNGLQWHVYVADALGAAYAPPPGFERPTHKLEVCMTDLARDAAAHFYREHHGRIVTAPEVTASTGIGALVPGADIDDYVFEPCGYSMNGILGNGFMTIHITPEDGFSYCSVEISGFDPAAYDPATMVARIVSIFKPARLSASLSVDVASPTGDYTWGALSAAPPGYGCQSATCQELSAGGRVSFYTMLLVDAMAADAAGAAAAAAAAASAAAGKARRPASPATVLRHMPSFSTCLSDLSDTDMQEMMSSGASGDEMDGSAASGAVAARPPRSPVFAGLRLAQRKRSLEAESGSDDGAPLLLQLAPVAV